jgi:hypothetical protein
MQTFVDTAKLLMQRYGDRIKHWEIWNEPNAYTNGDYKTNPTAAGGTYILPQVYSKLLAETFIQANQTITSQGLHLVAGGLFAHDIGGGFSPATDYMQQVYDLGPWDYLEANYGRRYPWDAFGYHIYIDQGGATTSQHIGQYLDAIAALRAQYSDASPVWITEFGWQAPSVVSEAQQAANIDLALTTFESRSEIERTFVFKVDDYDDWGIFRGDFSKKPAAQTMIAHDMGCVHLPKVKADAGADASADADADADAGARGDADAGARADANAGADASSNPNADPVANDGVNANAGAGGCAITSRADDWSATGVLALTLFALRRIRVRSKDAR